MPSNEKNDWLAKPGNESQLPPGAPGGPMVDGRSAERMEAWALYILVFVCGASLMSLEIVGGRALAPSFGSSVFVWGAIIGVFMAALAAGYYLGGMVADRRPSLGWLASIVGIAGAMVIALTYLAPRLCQYVETLNLGPGGGPLMASMLLYLPPSLFLGAVSPFAVRLRAKTVTGMGNVAGRLYALSTVGSLLGTLGTTFALIPSMKTTKILYMLGALLMAVAIMTMAAYFAARGAPRGSRASTATVCFLGFPVILAYFFCPVKLPGSVPPVSSVSIEPRYGWWHYVVDERESPYHTIAVVASFQPARVLNKYPDMKQFDSPRSLTLEQMKKGFELDPDAVLEMRFNDLTESSLYPNRTSKPPATQYTQVLHMGMALNPDARKVLVIGLGGGSVPRQFCSIYGSDMRVDAVDIDQAVLDVARTFFGFSDSADGPYRAYVEDARQFIRNPKAGRFEKYDLIILDAYSGGGQIPAHLVTREFLTQVKERLAPNGVLVSNIISPLEGRLNRFYRAEYRTLGELFPNIYVFPVLYDSERGNPLQRDYVRNLILVAPAAAGPRLAANELYDRAERLLERYPGAKEVQPLVRAKDYMATPSPSEITDVPVLTDAYAPVETMFWYEKRGR